MTIIVCKSLFLAREIAFITGPDETFIYPSSVETEKAPEIGKWLTDGLCHNRVTAVLYETRYFIDPAQFRAISPNTNFIVLSSPGDEQNTQTALVRGACAFIDKPLTAQDVCGVLALVAN